MYTYILYILYTYYQVWAISISIIIYIHLPIHPIWVYLNKTRSPTTSWLIIFPKIDLAGSGSGIYHFWTNPSQFYGLIPYIIWKRMVWLWYYFFHKTIDMISLWFTFMVLICFNYIISIPLWYPSTIIKYLVSIGYLYHEKLIREKYTKSMDMIHVYPYVYQEYLLYPHLSTFIHIYPHLSTFIHIYPHLSTFIHIYPHLSTFIHIYPHLSTWSLIY